MKNPIALSAVVAASVLAASVLAACTPSGQAAHSTTPLSSAEAARLVAPEPEARPAEYHAVDTTLRLLGVERLGDPSGAVAVIADEATWDTSAYRLGEPVARNLAVREIGAGGVVLEGAGQRISLAPGASAPARLVRHVFDTVVERSGDALLVDVESLRLLEARRGAAREARPFRSPLGAAAVGLRAVEEGTLLARLGLHPGDAVLAVDGEPATPALLDGALARLLAPGGGGVRLRILRNGEAWENRYQPR